MYFCLRHLVSFDFDNYVFAALLLLAWIKFQAEVQYQVESY